jgi:DNA-binding transcriptional LysR family regulator
VAPQTGRPVVAEQAPVPDVAPLIAQHADPAMELHEIRYFLAACETLNFTKAAADCGVAVPSLTRAIKKLEDELGGQLFRRERRLTHLTDLGRLMQRHFQTLQDAAETARTEAAQYLSANTKLKLGVISTMSSAHLVAFLKHLRHRAPGLDLEIWESHCADIAEALSRGDIDIAIMTLPDYSEDFRPVELFREPYQVAFARGHRFGNLPQVPLRELEGEDYVKRMHCEFPSNFAKLGIAKPYHAVRTRYSTEREDWVQTMVAAGLGITLMPKFLPVIADLELRDLVEPEVYRTVSIVTKAGRKHSPPVLKALEAARLMDWESPGPGS